MAESSTVGILRVLLTADTAAFETAMKRSTKEADAWKRSLQTIGSQSQAIGAALTKAITVPLAGIAAVAAKSAIDFESSFAGVRKTVDASEAEFAAMAQAFRNLAKEIPINVNELNRLGEAAGAMGIPKAAIVDFSKTMALLGVTTNVTADQAASSIGRIQNIFGAAGKDTDRFAATLVALGNAGASTESEILEMATRIAGAGSTIGLTQGEVLGFANALASVGLEAEAGGTAISRVFVDMSAAVSAGGKDLENFARVADMSAQDFATTFKRDASGAVLAFIEGLGRIKKEGGDLIGTLNQMGITEVRLRDTLLRAAGAGDLLRDSLNLQKQAWRDNSALTEEARKRFETTEAQLKLLWNRVKDVGITIGNTLLPAIQSLIGGVETLLPLIEGIAGAFGKLPGPIQAVVLAIGGIAVVAGPAFILFGQLATAGASLAAAFGKAGIATKLITGLMGTMTPAVAGAGAAATTSAGGFGLLASAIGFLTGPVGLSIIGLTGLAAAIYLVVTAETDLEKELKKSDTEFKKQTDTLARSLDIYRELSEKQNRTAKESADLAKATDVLAKASGLSASQFNLEEGQSDELTDALARQVRQRKELFSAAIDQARSAAAAAAQEEADARRRLAELRAGGGTVTERQTTPGGRDIEITRPITREERVEEVARLEAKIAALGKTASETNARLTALSGAKPYKDVELSADAAAAATQGAAAATQTFEQQIAAISESLAEKLRKVPGAFADIKAAIDSGIVSTDAIKAKYNLTEEELKLLTSQLREGAKATKEHAKEQDAAAKAADKQREALDKLHEEMASQGIITQQGYTTELGKFIEKFNIAASEGIPTLQAALRAAGTDLAKFRAAIIASGQSTAAFDSILKLTLERAGIAQMAADTIAWEQANIGAAGSLDAITRALPAVSAQTEVAAAEAQIITDAYHEFGQKTPQELQEVAKAAEFAYRQIVAAVGKNAPAAIEAHKKMVEAMNAASGKIPTYWETTVLPRMRGVFRTLQENLVDTLFGMRSASAEEHKRLADDATENYARVRESAEEEFKRIKESAEEEFRQIAADASKTPEEIKAAHDKMTADVTAAHAKMTKDVTGAHADMQEAIEKASHPFRDTIVDIFKDMGKGIIDIFKEILNAFIENVIKGSINALLGNRGGFAAAFADFFGGGGAGGGGGGMQQGIGGLIWKGIGKLFGFGGGAGLAGAPGTVTAGIPSFAGVGVPVAGGGTAGVGAGGAAAVPWWSTGLGGGAAGAGAGGVVGFMVGRSTGSAKGGIASGAATGATVGTLLGGPVGGLIGAGIGAAAGWYGAQKARKEANDFRDVFFTEVGKQLGGFEAGAGPGSTFAKVREMLDKAVGQVEGGKLFEQLIKADDADQLADAIARVSEVIGPMIEKEKAAIEAEKQHQAELAKTTEELNKKKAALVDQMKTLDQEIADWDRREAPEKHMGTREKQARERIAKEKATIQKALDDVQKKIDETAKKSAESFLKMVADGKGSYDAFAEYVRVNGGKIPQALLDALADADPKLKAQIDEWIAKFKELERVAEVPKVPSAPRTPGTPPQLPRTEPPPRPPASVPAPRLPPPREFPRLPGYAGGGIVQHSIDRVPAMLAEGEFVMRRESTRSLGRSALETLNRAGMGGLEHLAQTAAIPIPPAAAFAPRIGPQDGTTAAIAAYQQALAARPVNVTFEINAVDGASVERVVRSEEFRQSFTNVLRGNFAGFRTDVREATGVQK